MTSCADACPVASGDGETESGFHGGRQVDRRWCCSAGQLLREKPNLDRSAINEVPRFQGAVMIFAVQLVVRGDAVLPKWLIFTYLLHTMGELALSPWA